MKKSDCGGLEPSVTTDESTNADNGTESIIESVFSRQTFFGAAAALALLPQAASADSPSAEEIVEEA